MSDAFPKTIPLSKPVESGGEELREVTVREPIFGDLLAMDAATGDVAKMQHLVAKVCGIPPSTVAKMSPRDVAKITRDIIPFFADFLALSETLGAS